MTRSNLMLTATAMFALALAVVSNGATIPARPESIPACHAGVTCPGGDETSCLHVENDTECPVQVYLDDCSLGTCESFSTTTYHVRRTGCVQMTGRALCDTWGPDSRKLSPEQDATWRITAKGRNARVP